VPVNDTFIYLFLTDSQLNKFPWWPDLHGWWRTNPAYNTVFSTANSWQNYKSAALQHFCVPDCEDAQLPADENESQEDANIEDRKIIDTGDVDTNVDTNANVAGQLDDNIVMEPSDRFIHVQQAPMSSCLSSSALSFFHGSTSTGSYTSLPCPHPPITPISTNCSDPNVISLNSPDPPPDIQPDSKYSFYSSFKKPTSNYNTTPHNSDSDVSTTNAVKSLWVDSHKASPARGRPIMKLSGGSTRSALPQSPQVTSSHPPSHKRASDQASTATATEQLSETVHALMQQVTEKCDGHVEHDHYK